MTSTPGGLEYAARYTHHYTDGRQIVVINSRCADPADRAWAAEQVANMARIQTACEWPVDACLVTRRTTTAWAPEDPITDAQRDGWACIICHRNFAFEAPSVPAGSVQIDGSAWQVFRCSPSCPTPELTEECCGGGPRGNCPCMHPELTADFDAKLRERLTEVQRKGLACILCGAPYDDDAAMVRSGLLDGGALWRCSGACPTPATVAIEHERLDAELVKRLTLPPWDEVEVELVSIYSNAPSIRDALQGIYGRIQDMLVHELIAARAAMAGDE